MGPIRSFYNEKSSSMRGCFFACSKTAQKHGWYPCQSVLRASQNQAATLNHRKILRQPCSCHPGMRAHAVCGWYPCFCDGLSYFLRICRIRFASPAPGSGRRKSGACIQGFLISFCQSCIPAGIIAIYMTEGNRILPWSFRISFSIHLYCISTPFSQPSLKILL